MFAVNRAAREVGAVGHAGPAEDRGDLLPVAAGDPRAALLRARRGARRPPRPSKEANEVRN